MLELEGKSYSLMEAATRFVINPAALPGGIWGVRAPTMKFDNGFTVMVCPEC
jgi:hypothetical protein